MLWIFAGLASAQTFTIGPGLSYDTVEEAIASSSVPDGATLVLPAGDLEVAIVMDGARRLVIQGAGSTLTTLHGTGGGAAVALDGNADLTLTDVHVLGSENDASIRTPPDANVSLTIEDAIVDGGNIATGGGAVLISDGDLVLRRVTFDTPFVPAVPQAVYVKAVGSVVLMEDVEFSGAASTEYAAVSLYEAVSTLRRVDFHDNTTEGVAAALIITDGETTVEDSTFSGNTSATSAGAVRTELNARVTFIDTTFDGNTAANLGGGMYASSSSVSLEGCTFTGNVAVAGAAVLSNATTLDVLETSFSGNVAQNQGAVALLATSVGTFDHVDFEQNASDISVGALHVETDSEAVVTSSRFIGNTAAFVSAVAV
ncbi:MAG: right-handed parallel beta-helix repeat-containing protein, partial [Myxococcales bacterium]|nr:right-handed parallel beta-helix repeat-containing protein [Myxococcales bacterium]